MSNQIYRASFNPVDNTLSLHGIDAPKGDVVSVEGDSMILTAKVKGHRYQYGAYSDLSSYAGAVYQVYKVLEVNPYSDIDVTLSLELLTTIPVTFKGKAALSPAFKDLLRCNND